MLKTSSLSLVLLSLIESRVYSMSDSSADSNADSNSEPLLCTDAQECQNAEIDECSVGCYGYYACDTAQIKTDEALMYGAYAGYNSIIAADNVYGYGLYSLLYAEVKAESVYANGFVGASYAEIQAKVDQLYVQLYGYYGGAYASVMCYSGDYCNVECGKDRGCYGLSFYCYSGATCHYDCDDDQEHCPTLYGGVSHVGEQSMRLLLASGDSASDAKSDASDNNIFNKDSDNNNNNRRVYNKNSKFGLSDSEITEHLHRNREQRTAKIQSMKSGEVDKDFYDEAYDYIVNEKGDKMPENLLPVLHNVKSESNGESNNDISNIIENSGSSNSLWQFIEHSGYSSYIYFIAGLCFGEIMLGVILCFCFDIKCNSINPKNTEYQSLI